MDRAAISNMELQQYREGVQSLRRTKERIGIEDIVSDDRQTVKEMIEKSPVGQKFIILSGMLDEARSLREGATAERDEMQKGLNIWYADMMEKMVLEAEGSGADLAGDLTQALQGQPGKTATQPNATLRKPNQTELPHEAMQAALARSGTGVK